MGFFGASRKEKFVRAEAANLATYIKNNSVKFGGEAYAKSQAAGALPKDIDKALLWYFWSLVFAFRVAFETNDLSTLIDKSTYEALFKEFVAIDFQYFAPIEHTPYDSTFTSINNALDVIKQKNGMTFHEQASFFMLCSLSNIERQTDQEKKFTMVQSLSEAAMSFPSLRTIVEKNA